MSKPIARFAFFVLISLVLIAATSAGVRGWLGGTSQHAASVQSHAVSGLQTNLNHDRATAAELQSLQISAQPQIQPDRGHGGCQSEGKNTSNDY